MTETPTVGDPGAGGNQPPVSEKPIEGEAERLSKLFDAKLSDALKPVLAEIRGVQSRQDKDRNGLREVLDEFNKLRAKGLSDEDAANAMIEGRKSQEKDELLYKIAQKVGVIEPPSTQVPGKDVSGADEATRTLEQYHLDGNDPAVLPLLSLKGAELKAAAADLAYRRATQPAPSPTAAAALQSAPQSGLSKEQEQAALMETWERVKFNPTSAEYKATKQKLFGGDKK